MYSGDCSETPSAKITAKEAEENLQETINKCIASGQGSNCGVGPIASNSQQSNTQTKTSQTPIAADGLDDDPKVFGGSSNLTSTK